MGTTTKGKKCNSCEKTGSIVKPWRYCGKDLECSGIIKGDDLNEVIKKLDEASCGGSTISCDFEVDIEYDRFTDTLSTVKTGGTAPYTYKWSIKQSGFKYNTTLQNDTSDSPIIVKNICDYSEPNQQCFINMGASSGNPSAFYQVFVTVKVKDANGCAAQDSYLIWYPEYF